jgi:hypothetical protein
MTPFNLPPLNQVVVTVGFLFTPTDTTIAPYPIPVGNVTLVSSDPTILTVTPPANTVGPNDAYDFTLKSTGSLGTVTLSATGTLADGTAVVGTQDVAIAAAPPTGATSIVFTFGTPTPIVP